MWNKKCDGKTLFSFICVNISTRLVGIVLKNASKDLIYDLVDKEEKFLYIYMRPWYINATRFFGTTQYTKPFSLK